MSARFQKSWPDGNFMGWDDTGNDAECVSAFYPDDLGTWMSPTDTEIFEKLDPGAIFVSDDKIEYFRKF